MNKKGNKKKDKISVNEDLAIRNVAYSNNFPSIVLLFVLIVLFGLTLFCTLFYVGKYYKKDDAREPEVIEITNKKNKVIIKNSGLINKKIDDYDLIGSSDIIIENTDTIELLIDKDSEDGIMSYNVKYILEKNEFPYNILANNDSDVLIRFSYSYDNTNWTYVNNVIRSSNSNISPIMGSYFDVSGIEDELSIVTNYTIDYNASDHIKMYWKCETVIKNRDSNLNKNLKANFKIEYLGS